MEDFQDTMISRRNWPNMSRKLTGGKKAIRMVLSMKIILSIATITAVDGWLKNQHTKEVLAFTCSSEIADE